MISIKYFSRIVWIALSLFIIRCYDNGSITVFDIESLVSMGDVKKAGQELMSRGKPGFIQIVSPKSPQIGIHYIALHGYASEGYEWIYPLSRLAEQGAKTFFYRYDWNSCPGDISNQLSTDLINLISEYPDTTKWVLFSHSYGGLIAALLKKDLPDRIQIEIHTIASPLAGYPRLTENCMEDIQLIPEYTYTGEFSLTQWRTAHEQDGAFRDLETDPQVIFIPGSQVISLPDSMNGHRLGHNWSITWAIDRYFNQE